VKRIYAVNRGVVIISDKDGAEDNTGQTTNKKKSIPQLMTNPASPLLIPSLYQ
jgi:hypothetical protein